MFVTSNRAFGVPRSSSGTQVARAPLVGLLLAWLTVGGCETPGPPATAPATTSPVGAPVPATAPADAKLRGAVRAYLDALQARDREKLREMVFLPSDPQRRQWVLETMNKGLFPPAGAKVLASEVKMHGPVAVVEGKLLNFQQASIRLLRRMLPGQAAVPAPLEIQGEELSALLALFPGAGTGRDSKVYRGWVAGVEITLTAEDGSVVTIFVDTRLRWWRESAGDWDLDERFQDFMRRKFPDVNFDASGAATKPSEE